MQFEIEAAPSAGLRVISNVPEGTHIQIDGRNGIGKTLAIRLLQLVTTSQPFADKPQSWITLRDNLNPVVIKATGLKRGKSLRFELTPSQWPSEPKPPGDWLGSVLLDGKRIDWSTVPKLLSVRRIGGDETLGESLAAQVATDREIVRQVLIEQSTRRADWNHRVGALRLLTEVPAAFDFARLRERAKTLTNEAARAASELAIERTNLLNLAEAQRLLAKRSELKRQRPILTKQISDLAARDEILRSKSRDLDERAAELLAQTQQTADVLKDVERLIGLQQKRRDRRERRRRELADLSELANVAAPVDLAAAQEQLRDLRRRRSALEKQRESADRAGLMLDFIDSIEGPVNRALSASLGPEPVAQLPTGQLTLSEFGNGVTTRREALERTERGAGTEIRRALAAVEAQLQACSKIPDAVRLLNGAESDLDATETQLNMYLHSLSGGVADQYEEVNRERLGYLDSLTQLVEERSQAEAQLGELLAHGDEADLARAAQTLLTDLGLPANTVAASDLKDAEREQAEALAAAELAATKASAERDRARYELAQAEAAVQGATNELNDNPAHAWLRDEGLPTPDESLHIDSQIGALRRLGNGVGRTDDLLLATLNAQQSLDQELEGLVQRLRASGTAGQVQGGQGEYSVRVNAFYQRRFAEELSTEMVRNALFAGGSDISVDLRKMSTSWTLPNGQRNTRPLEAFSSGERAFAYTRIQVERLAQDRSENRVIFLDEFGSFVAQDRFEELRRYLRTPTARNAADKIVLVLPLRRVPSEPEQLELLERGGYLVSEID